MRRRDILLLMGMILLAGAVAFGIGRTVAVRRPTQALGERSEWLANVPPEAITAEQRFAERARRLTAAVRAQQVLLATMLPNTEFTGEQVLAQVDNVAQAHATLAQAVGGHLASLRRTLPEPQGRHLMLSCAHSLQGSMQRRYRWRGGAQDPGESYPGGRGGPGRGEGGRGAGFRQQYRGGRNEGTYGLARRLRLTDEQVAWIRQYDPDFEPECLVLRDRLHTAHTDLVASFQKEWSTNEELRARVDALIQAHDTLEKRVARHLVLLRPRLSAEQRDLLANLNRQSAAASPNPTDRDSFGASISGLSPQPTLAGLL